MYRNIPITGRPSPGTQRRAERNRTRERGSVIVENVLVMILLFTVLFGIMGFSLAVFAYNTVGYAAREGARYEIVHGSQSSSPDTTGAAGTSLVKQKALGLNPANLKVTITNAGATPGTVVTVTVTYTYKWQVTLIPIPNTTLSSTSKMTILQ